MRGDARDEKKCAHLMRRIAEKSVVRFTPLAKSTHCRRCDTVILDRCAPGPALRRALQEGGQVPCSRNNRAPEPCPHAHPKGASGAQLCGLWAGASRANAVRPQDCQKPASSRRAKEGKKKEQKGTKDFHNSFLMCFSFFLFFLFPFFTTLND